MTPKRALWILIAVSALVHLVAAWNLGLGNDEAYHFLYAVYPSLSYYDHPPMLAWVETVGLTLAGSPYSAVALRAGFIGLFAGSTWLLGRIAGRWYGPWAGFYAALALNLSGYYGLAASTFALPDGPLLFFWLLTIDRLDVALNQPRRNVPWLWVGLAWGGAMLSKYHAIFLPASALLLLAAHRPMRQWLVRPGPYLAMAVGLVVFSPVIVWNAAHGWASFLFQGGRAVGGFVFRPDYVATALLAQMGYLFPWIWLPLIGLLAHALRNWRRLESEHERMALCLAVVPFGVFTAVACFRPVLPHWGLIGSISLFPSLGNLWRTKVDLRPASTRLWLTTGAGLSLVVMAIALLEHRTGCFQRGDNGGWGILDTRTDPTADLYGWDKVAAKLEELGVLDDPKSFLFTRNWYQSAQIAHAIHLKRPVLCYNIDDPRGFAFWSKPDEWVGGNGILVLIDDEFTPLPFFRRWFQDAIPLADFSVERGGRPFRRIRAIRLVNQLAAFPYTFSPERVAARELIRAGGHPMDSAARTTDGAASSEKVRR